MNLGSRVRGRGSRLKGPGLGQGVSSRSGVCSRVWGSGLALRLRLGVSSGLGFRISHGVGALGLLWDLGLRSGARG